MKGEGKPEVVDLDQGGFIERIKKRFKNEKFFLQDAQNELAAYVDKLKEVKTKQRAEFLKKRIDELQKEIESRELDCRVVQNFIDDFENARAGIKKEIESLLKPGEKPRA